MKISNIKSLEKYLNYLNEQILDAQRQNQTDEENNILQELTNELNRISGHLNHLRVIKKSPPGLIINVLKNHINQNFPSLIDQINFIIQDEKNIEIIINSRFLGYNLESDDNYEPINEQDSEDWNNYTEDISRRNCPNRSSFDRLNNLDKGLSFEINATYTRYDQEGLCFYVEFNKVHANSDIIEPLWFDVLREIVVICNYHRNRKQLELI